MARKKVVTTTEEIPEEAINVTNSLPALEDDPIATFLQQFPNSNIKFKVSKYVNGGLEYQFQSNESFDEEFLQEHYGGGRYLVKVFRDNIQETKFDMRVAPRSGPATMPDVPTPAQNNGHTNDTKNGNGSNRDFLEALVLGLIGNRSQTSSISELAEAVKLVQPATNAGSKTDYIDGFKEGLKIGAQTGGGGMDWKQRAMEIAGDVLPGIATAIGSLRPSNVPNVAGQTGEQVIDQGEKQIFDAMQEMKKYFMMGVSPDTIVDLAIAKVNTDERINAIVRKCFNTDFAVFAKIDPEIANEPFATKFKLVYDGLRSAFAQHDEVDDDSDGESGNVRDVTNNESVSARGGTKRTG